MAVRLLLPGAEHSFAERQVGRTIASFVAPDQEDLMRKLSTYSLLLVSVAILLIAAVPQDPKQGRVAVKYGDRMSDCVGKHFNFSPDMSEAMEVGDAAAARFKLVAVGVDYVEFEATDMRVVVPLNFIRFSLAK